MRLKFIMTSMVVVGSLLGAETVLAQQTEVRAGSILCVDQRGGTAYASIAAAAKVAQPGDMILLAKGSGPYRETVYINRSGEPEHPIIFDGNGEVVTGFEPLHFEKHDGVWSCNLDTIIRNFKNVQGFEKKEGSWISPDMPRLLPTVISYHGHRIFQEAGTGNLTPYAKLASDNRTLILEPNADAEGWEIASRDFVFRIYNVSHHVYRNTRASGSLNDGYNLHGVGTDIIFENIEGFQNIDEGFSAHDQIECVIRRGRFWENENGLCNAPTCTMVAQDIETFSNSGWGFGLMRCSAELSNIHSWDNGVRQVTFLSAKVTCRHVVAGGMKSSAIPWMTAQESRRAKQAEPVFTSADCQITGTVEVGGK